MPFYELPGPKVVEKYTEYLRIAKADPNGEWNSNEYWMSCGFKAACTMFFGTVYAGSLIMQSDSLLEEETAQAVQTFPEAYEGAKARQPLVGEILQLSPIPGKLDVPRFSSTDEPGV